MYRTFGKRLLDIALAILAIGVFAPVLVLIAVLVRITSRGPVLFVQERLGRAATVFRAFKFRTMVDRHRVPDTEFFKGDESDITWIGKWLRRTKLDELPQLFNVLRGEMSIVGPRPQLPIQLNEFDHNARTRLQVRPGLTGMAQVHGNTRLTWPERWHYDAEYVRNLSLRLDLWIIGRTLSVLLHGEDRFLRRPGGDAAEERI